MDKSVLEYSFRNFLKGKGLELEGLSLQTFPDFFIEYFQNVKFEGFSEEDDSDMLLFQYGNYDSNFSINFTRQIYEVFEDDCHQILQLSLTFFYDLVGFSDVISLSKWSINFENLTRFHKFIVNSEAFSIANNKVPKKIDFYVDLV